MSAIRYHHHQRANFEGDRLYIPPSQINLGTVVSGTWARGIPTAGVNMGGTITIPAATGPELASCLNLFASSPPFLTQRYELQRFAIGFGIVFTGASNPSVVIELAFLLNGRRIYQEEQTISLFTAAPGGIGSGAFTSDLVNHIAIHNGETLSLQIGASPSVTSTAFNICVGTQVDNNQNPVDYQSTISYRIASASASAGDKLAFG